MKKIVFIGALLCTSLISMTSYAAASSQSLDQIVAVVNDDVITTTELNHAIDSIKIQMQQAQQPVPPASVLNKQVLNQLINKRVQLQMAEQVGVQATSDDLDNTVKRIAEQNHMSVSEFYDRVAQEGISKAEYREEMHDQITIQKLQQQQISRKISVTQQEVSAFMRTQAWRTNGATEYHLEDILIPLSDTPSSEDIVASRKRAEAIVAELHKGRTFSEVAQTESSGKNALQGGDLGWRKLPEIPSAFIESVSTMKKNDIAGPIQTPNGFHVIRLSDTRALTSKDAVPDRKQIQEFLLQRKYEEAVQTWASKLRGQAFIKITT